MLLDTLMPTYDFHETHGVLVRATPERTYAALREVTPEEMALLRTLFAIRALPARLTGRRGPLFAARQPLLQQMLRGGFVLLDEEPDHELVLGTVGQFWRAAGGQSVRVANAQEFLAFDRPDYARAAMNFRMEPRPTGGVTLTTETRVRIPDPVARRKFAIYWRLIVLGSGLIRKMMLQAVKRRAERS